MCDLGAERDVHEVPRVMSDAYESCSTGGRARPWQYDAHEHLRQDKARCRPEVERT